MSTESFNLDAPFEFAPAAFVDAGEALPGVRVRIGFPFNQVLFHLLDQDPGTSPLGADTTLATVPGAETDVFAQLEAEVVADRLAQAQAERRAETRETVARILAPRPRGGIDMVVPADDAQDMLEWLNRMYVTIRTAELNSAGDEPAVGEAQSAGVFLGVLGDTEADDEKAPPMGAYTLLLAVLVDLLQTALDEAAF